MMTGEAVAMWESCMIINGHLDRNVDLESSTATVA